MRSGPYSWRATTDMLPSRRNQGGAAMDAMWPTGSAYINGRFMPVGEAMIPVTDWGYRRSDVTYDVVSVWDGAFFRLGDHLKRFRGSIEMMRFKPQETNEDIRRILHHLVALTGLRNAYVAMDCMRARPRPDQRY